MSISTSDATPLAELSLKVWRQVCLHCDGMALGSTLASLGWPEVRSGGNPGYRAAAQRLLQCQGWVDRQGQLTDLGGRVAPHAGAYAAAPGLLEQAQVILRDPARARLEPSWSQLPEVCRLHLEGHVVAPLMVALRALWPQDHPVLRQLGWVDPGGRPTPAGELAFRMAPVYAYPVTYLNTLRRVDELLLGDPRQVLARDEQGDETHVDRERDVRFSGEVFSGSVSEPFLQLFLPWFQGDRQPDFVVDTGCGDASMLRGLYEAVRQRSSRDLAACPLVMVGAELNRQAAEVARATLSGAGIPHQVLFGDIGDPGGLAAQLQAAGVDLRRAVHVNKSVLHNRRYRPPRAQPGPARSRAVFVDARGQLIAPQLVEQNLLELLQDWKPLIEPFGMLVAEAHTVDPALAAGFLGRCLATTLDATHLYSGQLLMEMQVFRQIAREAGLVSRGSRDLGAQTFGYPSMSVDRFTS